MKLAAWSLACYRLAYTREVRWADGVETSGAFALLRLTSTDGAAGIAEGAVKPTWSGTSPRALHAAIEDVLLPRLHGVDLGDADAVSTRLGSVPENVLAKGLIETACATMRAAVAGIPLWRQWGGDPRVDLSWTVTRQPPGRMAEEAAAMVSRFGFRTLKVKGGQGLATDLRALADIRAAVGPGVALYVDANDAYPLAEAVDYVRRIADAGAMLAEDPCPFAPDDRFAALQRSAPIPVLVDDACVTTRDAGLFLGQGAVALSAKPGRVGLVQARAIAQQAEAAGARAVAGLHAESALGTLVGLQQAAAVPTAARAAAAELTFFLALREQVLAAPIEVREGAVTLPGHHDLAELVDWDRVRRYAL